MVTVETARQARGAQLAFAVQVAGVVVSYVLQIVLARALGPAGFGSYSFVLAWTGPLAMLAGLGLPTVALRFLPVYKDAADVERLAGLVRASERIALAASVAIALAGSIRRCCCSPSRCRCSSASGRCRSRSSCGSSRSSRARRGASGSR